MLVFFIALTIIFGMIEINLIKGFDTGKETTLRMIIILFVQTTVLVSLIGILICI